MLTPAEELGLSGVKLAGLVRKAFLKVPEAELCALVRQLREEAGRRGLRYWRNGELETIRILALPLTALPEQLSYIRYACLTILGALKRLPDLYLHDGTVRQTIALAATEESWLKECWTVSHAESNPVFGRLDAVVDLTSAMWKNSLHFLEPNLSGVGGIQFGPTCEELFLDLILPLIQAQDPRLHLKPGQDARELLIQEVLDHLETIGRPAQTLCFVEPKYATSGPEEQEALSRYCRERHNIDVVHADPRELILEGDEVLCQGKRIDVAYRDYEVRDLIELGTQGVDIAPIHTLFRQNRMVSTIAGDFDHKSCWEILTDPILVRRHFSTDERRVFRQHILWTRVIAQRRTELPDGDVDDLLGYMRRDQENLVLKPNRSYGGDCVLIGPAVSVETWEAAIAKALAEPGAWVVQQLGKIPVHEFPVVGSDGAVSLEPFYAVMGFTPSHYGLSSLVRASQKQVVNVAQRGGLSTLCIGYPPSAPLGPDGTHDS